MASLKIVLDTNAILRCISRRSAYGIIMDKLYEKSFELFICNDIYHEYEEKISDIFSSETAELLLGAFSLMDNVKKIEVYFHLNLMPTDPDDNKFADCAFAGNVHYLVTDDKHFNVLKSLFFPAINVISLEKFREMLLNN